MKILKGNFNLKSTLLSGQCFRVSEENDGSFTIILEDRVVNVKDDDKYLEINSNNEDNLEKVIIDYFDLKRDYNKINHSLLNSDFSLKEVITYCEGYKILNQSNFEMIISYIISQNNTVKNISRCVEKLSELFGKKVFFNNKYYYLFPSFDELKNVSEGSLKKCSVGFRSKYIINALEEIKKESNYFDSINNLSTEESLEKLMKIKGIGMKVASCILMFAYGRMDAFPIDTWVKKFFNSNKENEIREIAYQKFGKYCGLAIQYMFHYSRNKDVL